MIVRSIHFNLKKLKKNPWSSIFVGFPVLDDFLTVKFYSKPTLPTEMEDMK